jgi:hypothetical protein
MKKLLYLILGMVCLIISWESYLYFMQSPEIAKKDAEAAFQKACIKREIDRRRFGEPIYQGNVSGAYKFAFVEKNDGVSVFVIVSFAPHYSEVLF